VSRRNNDNEEEEANTLLDPKFEDIFGNRGFFFLHTPIRTTTSLVHRVQSI
jgi:hypothetical protein